MVSSPISQIHSSSVDLAGLSVATANPSTSILQQGSVYDPTQLAAAVPVAFVPTDSSNYIMLNSQRWISATGSSTSAGYYSAHTLDSLPSWFLVNGSTGTKSVINSSPTIPMSTANTSRTLTAVESRSPHFLYTLNDVVNGTTHSAVLQVWNLNTQLKTVLPIGEETIPPALNGSGYGPGSWSTGSNPVWTGSDAILFNTGLYRDGIYMYVLGRGGSTNALYMARKPWGQLSHTHKSDPTAAAPLPYWEFYNGSGWVSDTNSCAPIQSSSGPITSHGPVSVAHYGLRRAMPGRSTNYLALSTVAASGTARSAQVYTSLGGRPWIADPETVSLGTAGSTYLGGTLQCQGMLGANPAMVTPGDSASAWPHVTAVVGSSGSDSQITLNWGLRQIPRQQ